MNARSQLFPSNILLTELAKTAENKGKHQTLCFPQVIAVTAG
jgi:hypothetical protein